MTSKSHESIIRRVCLLCNALVPPSSSNVHDVTTTKREKRKRRRSPVEEMNPSTLDLSQSLCKALDIPSDVFKQKLVEKPLCLSCVQSVTEFEEVVIAMEQLQALTQGFRCRILNSLAGFCDAKGNWSAGKRRRNRDDGKLNEIRNEIVISLRSKEEYTSIGNTPPSMDGVVGGAKQILRNLSLSLPSLVAKEGLNIDSKKREGTVSAEASKPDMFTSIKEEFSMSSEGEDWALESEAEEILKFNLNVNDKMEVDHDGVREDDSQKDVEPGTNSKIRKKMPSSIKHLRCDVEGCDKTFTKAPLWRKHRRVHQESGNEERFEKRYSCGVCGNVYETKNSLDRHSSTHTGTWKHPCPTCNKGFHRPSSLKVHLAKEHNAEKSYSCSFCDSKFVSRKCLVVHLSTSHPEHTDPSQSTLCDMCHKVFSGRDTLKCHKIQVHGSTVKYHHVCPVCSKGFAKKSWMERHCLQHSSDKTFACEECGEKFKFPNSLSYHQKKHTDTKPFQCSHSDCRKRFTLRTTLNLHMMTHREEKSFTCEYCGKNFKLPTYLGNHMKRKHFKEVGLSSPPKYCTKKRRGKSPSHQRKIKRQRPILDSSSTTTASSTIPAREQMKPDPVEIVYEDPQNIILEEVEMEQGDILGTVTLTGESGDPQYIQVYVQPSSASQ